MGNLLKPIQSKADFGLIFGRFNFCSGKVPAMQWQMVYWHPSEWGWHERSTYSALTQHWWDDQQEGSNNFRKCWHFGAKLKPTQRGWKAVANPLTADTCIVHAWHMPLTDIIISIKSQVNNCWTKDSKNCWGESCWYWPSCVWILYILTEYTVFTTGRHHVTQAAARQIARFILFNPAAGCIIQLVYHAHRGWSRAGWLYRLLGGDILPVCGLTRSQLAEHIFAIVFEGLPNALLYNI